MLKDIISIIDNSRSILEGSTLLCEYEIQDIVLFSALNQEEIIENILTNKPKLGDKITLEFSIFKLKSLGFFYDKSFFIKNHRYELPSHPIYLNDLKQYLVDTDFYCSYISMVNLINTLLVNSKHSYDDAGTKKLIIVREEKSLFINLNYDSAAVNLLSGKTCEHINTLICILNDENFPDKKNIYLNELAEFCLKYDEDSRFFSLLANFNTFINNASATYDFYLTNFSYNKLKLEIDSKAIEYNQKLQAIINDSQTKLIAIPTAFVFVLSSLDYDKIDTAKNIIAVGGLFIFSMVLQLFVNNQKSAIKFIEENINHYKSTFKNQARTEVEKTFNNVNSEKNKQFDRLIFIEVILWFIPIFTTSLILFLMSFQIGAIVIMFFFLWISSNKIFLKY